MDRIQRSEATYARLFGPRDTAAPDPDPELGAILRRLIFGEVFHTGSLDERTRELITVTLLTTMQTLPQLQAHAGAALNIGVTPVQLREAVYQCAPFIGFPKTLNAVAVLNEVFTAQGIDLPLPEQGTTTEEDRFEAGRALQIPIYGDEIAESVAGLPEPFREAVPRFLTAFGFGDFYTRDGLDVPTRELLILCLLAALGQAAQIKAHIIGNLRLGNSKATQVAALVHCFPYIGFPLALNAIRVIQEVPDQPTI